MRASQSAMNLRTLDEGACTQLTARPSSSESVTNEVISGMMRPFVIRSMALLIATQASLTEGW